MSRLQEDDPRTRIEARLSQRMEERVDDYSDQEGVTKSEIVRAALDDYLPDSDAGHDGPRIRPPSTPELQHTLGVLQRLARNNDGTVPKEAAMQELAQKHSRDKRTCDSTLIQPLINEGYVKERGGGLYSRGRNTLRVVLPDDIPSILAESDIDVDPETADREHVADEWARLESATPAGGPADD